MKITDLTVQDHFTKEQLMERAQEVITSTNEALQENMTGELREIYVRSLALAEIALAALGAEPVGYINRYTGEFHKPERMSGDDLDRQLYFPVFGAHPLVGGAK